MKFSARALGLKINFLLVRLNWLVLIAGFACVTGIAFWLFAVPHANAGLAEQKDKLKHVRQSFQTTQKTVSVIRQPLADERAALFYQTLGKKRHAEQHVRILFALAKKSGLSLDQAEYKSSFDKKGNFQTYQIRIPVKGSYGAIRQFCTSILLTVPYSSLDEMNFKREAVGKGTVEARLRFTLYLTDEVPTPPLDPQASRHEDLPS